MADITSKILDAANDSSCHPLTLPWIFVPLLLAIVTFIGSIALFKSAARHEERSPSLSWFLPIVAITLLVCALYLAVLALGHSGVQPW